MSTSGSNGLSLGAGATGDLGESTPTGFSMPDGSGSTLFSMPGGGAATPGQMQTNPMSMGQGFTNGPMLSGNGTGFNSAQLLGMLGGAGGNGVGKDAMTGGYKSQGTDMASGMHGVGARGGGSVDYLPSSAITSPYTLSTGGAQSLLQQIMNQNKLNPLG